MAGRPAARSRGLADHRGLAQVPRRRPGRELPAGPRGGRQGGAGARAGGGPPLVTDGPFAEAKEFLAGYWVLDCKSPERVYEIAARISAAPGRGGAPMNFAVEVSPVGVAPDV